ncbi:sensor histidine kinase [Paenibacillus sp. CAU 1782]
MIKSLYLRMVLTFFTIVVAGSVIAFYVAVWVFQEKLNENLQALLLNFGTDTVRVYESLPGDEAESYLRDMKQLDSYYIRIFDQSGQVQSYGSLNDHTLATVTMEQIKTVLAGGMVQVNSNGVSAILLGLPLQTEDGVKAMFVDPLTPPSTAFLIRWIYSFLIYFLLIGSLLILISSIYLIRPINKLTKATKRIARGDFDVKLNIKQSGELGDLARSFEQMTHDLRQLEQMRRDFVANVSHEIKSPLTSISGYAIALKGVDLPEKERGRYLDIIIEEAERMSRMNDGLLKLSLLESHSQQLQPSEYSLDEQIRRVIVLLQPQWSARNIGFDLQLHTTKITADYELLNQVWSNIIVNSIKFSEIDGTVSIVIEQDAYSVTVSIRDNGIGIAPEDQKHIFDRFFKADRSHKRKNNGSGIGLAIVKQIVSLHGGALAVESQFGVGTTISVTLPMKQDNPLFA